MGLSILTNVASLGVRRNLFHATEGLNQSFSRLSSGLRITRAADDAAGLGISESMRADIRSLSVAERNIQDGIGLVQSADAALGQTMDILARIRELALQASSETLSTGDRDVLTNEYEELVDEMGRVIADAEFNGVQLLNATSTIEIQTGTQSGQDVEITTANLSFFPVIFDFFNLDAAGLSGTVNFLSEFSTDFFSEQRGRFGAAQNRLESALRSTRAYRENLSASESRIRDVDVAEETSNLARNQILQQGATQVLAQANLQPQLALQLLG